jgi:hypothetical protein
LSIFKLSPAEAAQQQRLKLVMDFLETEAAKALVPVGGSLAHQAVAGLVGQTAASDFI